MGRPAEFAEAQAAALRAEARLNAVAPEMLAALKDVLDTIDGMVDVKDGEDGPVPNWAMRLTQDIERVIEKAEGR